MKSFSLRCCGFLLLLGLMTPLTAQHFSLTTHTNFVPYVADFSTADVQQSLGLDLRIFSNENWAFRFGTSMQGQNVYDVFNGAYTITRTERTGFDWDEINWDDDDWDLDEIDHQIGYSECTYNEFDTERFNEDYTVFAEVGVERHFFLFDEKLDIYPGVYLPIQLNNQTSLQQVLQKDALLNNAGAVLGGSIRLLRIFRVGVELEANMVQTGNAIGQSFREATVAPIKAIPYQTSMTFGLAF